MKIVTLLLFLALVSPYGAIIHKESVSLDYGKRFDSNILLPDSVTGKSAIITEVSVAPSFLVQFNPATMLKCGFSMGAEEQDAFPNTNVKRLGLSMNSKHLFSHLTMAGIGAEWNKNYSDNAFYESNDFAVSLLGGRYLSPKTNLEINLTGTQKSFPSLYRNSIKDLAQKSFYYDYRQAELECRYRRIQSEQWSFVWTMSGGYKDFYNDTHDSDYVGYFPVINYIDINTGDTIYLPPEDSAVPIYQANIHQKDKNLYTGLSATWSPVSGLAFMPRLSGSMTFSNDEYFKSRSMSMETLARCRFGQSFVKLSYNFQYETYPARKKPDDGRWEKSHYAGFTYGYDLFDNISLQCSLNYRKFNSASDRDDYVKKTATLTLSATR